MDYGVVATTTRHASWAKFLEHQGRSEGRLLLFTTRGARNFTGFSYRPGDTLLFGQESAGVPDHVHAAADERLIIPIVAQARSLNLGVSCGIGLAEALRQTGGFPPMPQTR